MAQRPDRRALGGSREIEMTNPLPAGWQVASVIHFENVAVEFIGRAEHKQERTEDHHE
jgi:hypothetical protein